MKNSPAAPISNWIAQLSAIACLLAALLPQASLAATDKDPTPVSEPPLSCTTAREFIASLEFLRDQKEFSLPEAEARKLAAKVAGGCTGAAGRFIRVARTLSIAGLGTRNALSIGEEFALRTDREADTFLTVFRKAFSEEGLDLELGASIRLARSLTSGFDGDILRVRNDFDALLAYCLSPEKLALPRPQCGDFAAEIARKGNRWSVGSASQTFIKLYEFSRSDGDGPNLTTADALKIARETADAGPDSADNFIQSFRYATSRKGMDLPRDRAVSFAREVAFQASFTPPQPTADSASGKLKTAK